MSPMVVDLPDPDGPTKAVTVPGLGFERNAVQDGAAGFVAELHILEAHVTDDGPDLPRSVGILDPQAARA